MEPMPPDVLALLAKPNPAVVATVRRDGRPVSAAVWYLWDDGEVLLVMSSTGARRKHLERDPRLTLTVLDDASWYRQVTLHGEAVAVAEDEGLAVTDRLSRHYTGGPFDHREVPHAVARVRVSDWNSFDVG